VAYHQQQQQQQQQQHQYYNLSEDLQHFPTHQSGIVHDQHPPHPITLDHHNLHSPPPLEAYSHNQNHPLQQQQQMCFLVEPEMTPSTIKFESPSLLHTHTLLLE
jgi:hypothetical protein